MKPVVIYSKAYRSTDDAREGYNSGDDIPFGSDGSAYYDSNLDGTVIPLKYNINRRGVMYGRNDTSAFTPNTVPDIWVQWEQWIDQKFIDDMDVAGPNKGIPLPKGQTFITQNCFAWVALLTDAVITQK